MNVVIIGCGYVGSAVARYWRYQRSLAVTVTTTTAERIPDLQVLSQRVRLLKCSDTEELKYILKEQEIALVSVASKASSYEESYLKTAEALVNVLQGNSTLKQLIYTSSISVYGDQGINLVCEEDNPNPISDKSRILLRTEELLLSMSSRKLNICVLRLGGIYGPDRELVKIYSRFAGKSRLGDGRKPANWIHLDDIVGAIEFARQHSLKGVYNLVDDSKLTQGQVIEKVCEKYSLQPVIWDYNQSKQVQHNVSNQKIKDAGYQLIHPKIAF
ncbi:Nucleoside-diphosphate-sugar epimerases [Richelia intracellularis HH01]|uniref:Nucleoside-diphosphate-sugar epimerases n=1 Tax=Richelia intracellularis HH01 TaxID=1165094 RepID=M1X6A9_9NOST|nr:NAD-dependent epimerase/dehydratase family protein [Richelia intracellularis]CCH68011.1 Nucleoside-diphosphate-sugar epimerases [Richelia intracellularis HH01]